MNFGGNCCSLRLAALAAFRSTLSCTIHPLCIDRHN